MQYWTLVERIWCIFYSYVFLFFSSIIQLCFHHSYYIIYTAVTLVSQLNLSSILPFWMSSTVLAILDATGPGVAAPS
jgi:hypothetical protein